MSEVLDILIRARKRIANEQRWCQGSYAIDSRGASVPPDAESACRWCGAGAIMAEVGYDFHLRDEADAELQTKSVPRDIRSVNDRYGHEAVLVRYDATIARLRGES